MYGETEGPEVGLAIGALLALAGAQASSVAGAFELPDIPLYTSIRAEAETFGAIEADALRLSTALLLRLQDRHDRSTASASEVARVTDFIDHFLIGDLGPRIPTEPGELRQAIAAHLGDDYAEVWTQP